MDYKIVFFDVDGTLTSHKDGKIPESTKLAIQALQHKGLKVVAATGRPLSMCGVVRELGIDTFITANGGHVKHGEQVIHKVPVEPKNLREVYDYAVSQQHGMSFYTEEFCMNGIQDTTIMQALQETFFMEEYPVFNPLICEQEVYLMCLFANDSMLEGYQDKFPHLTFRRWHPYVLNVLQDEVCKSAAILKVLEYFGLDAAEAIAFGDGENDIDMLELVGLGIAMGNGGDRLKQAADFVTKASGEDGIGYALRRYGVI
ncbi:Cof-type HAD-IIB family hydrolase [Paenibacillus sp. GCM10012306]|uniref:Cof-type HAD-IIB family hydrolase n=1 Tax=Paenibacillus sp. GCM10012306 TaxID=3317342 RepID=UPI003616FAD4